MKMPISIEVDGVTGLLRELSVELETGERGYFQRGLKDCTRAAVATAIQRPYEELPEMIDFPEIAAWAESAGYTVDVHFADPPVELDRWVGLSPADEDRTRHTVVMEGDRLLFDPASGWDFGPDFDPARISEIEFGISFTKNNTGGTDAHR